MLYRYRVAVECSVDCVVTAEEMNSLVIFFYFEVQSSAVVKDSLVCIVPVSRPNKFGCNWYSLGIYIVVSPFRPRSQVPIITKY
jgi:hypothetical protein